MTDYLKIEKKIDDSLEANQQKVDEKSGIPGYHCERAPRTILQRPTRYV